MHFEHEAAVARHGEICGGDEAVVSRAGHDDVKVIARGRRLRFKRRGDKLRWFHRRAFQESTPADFTHGILPPDCLCEAKISWSDCSANLQVGVREFGPSQPKGERYIAHVKFYFAVG